jgi:hypothetical protein
LAATLTKERALAEATRKATTDKLKGLENDLQAAQQDWSKRQPKLSGVGAGEEKKRKGSRDNLLSQAGRMLGSLSAATALPKPKDKWGLSPDDPAGAVKAVVFEKGSMGMMMQPYALY